MSVATIEIIKIIISALTLLTVFFQLQRLIKQTKINERTEIANSIWEISDRWTSIYEQRKQILQMRQKSEQELEEEYISYNILINSQDWKSIRPVLNFYEVLGILIHKNLVPENEVFAIVTVDKYHNNDISNDKGRDGSMYKILAPYVQYLRKHYRSDIYHFYDRFLIEKYSNRTLLKPKK